MWKRANTRVAMVLAALGAVTSAPVSAALVTIVGTNFDLTYDDTKLGLFGAPTLVGDTLFFTPNAFAAESLNGAGAVTTNSTVSGLVLTAKNGYQFGAFDLAEFGDYRLNGASSFVTVTGQLRAFNVASSINTQTASFLAVDGSTPLTINNGLLQPWLATARIDAGTAPQAVPPQFGEALNVLATRPGAVGLTIENQLLAFTDPDGTGLRQAFIEKKFNGISVDVTPVPVPPAAAMMVLGLASLMLLRHRGKA